MNKYNDYDIKYPDLVIELIEYFKLDDHLKDKSIVGFCESHILPNDERYQPPVLNRICQSLCENNLMNCILNDQCFGLHSRYVSIISDNPVWTRFRDYLKLYYNSLAYGFDYIYRRYQEIVVPVVCKKENGDFSVGTAFRFGGGLVTAKHCIADPSNLSIRGFSSEELNSCRILVSENDWLDLVFLDLNRNDCTGVYSDTGKIMDEVLVMGYPKIPAFTDFLTAEKATISSKAESRLTPTKGTVAAKGLSIHSKTELLLITAKIRGGNSGGPVINKEGAVVGVACQTPCYGEKLGDYDDLGYGIAVPMTCFGELKKEYRVHEGFFVEFED